MYYLSGQILALDCIPENREKIAAVFLSSSMNWNGFVKMGSDNYVLPALYLKLQQYNLTPYLPEPLNEYLQEVLALNRERNLSVMREAVLVRDVFLKENIECLFMKGTGNILDGLYSDIGERMLYDLDVLVGEGNMLKAAGVLRNHGFFTQKEFIPRAVESTMHYPILLRSDLVAGVEIHRMAVQYLYQNKFSNQRILENRVAANKEKGFWLMQPADRLVHNFLHAQLMHSGHYHADVSLRDLYDLLLLSRKVDALDTFLHFGHYKQASLAYLKLMHKVFGLPMPRQLASSKYGYFFLKRHQVTLQMSSAQLRRYHLLIMFFQKYGVLPLRVLWSRKARNYVFSRLSNRNWYHEHWEAIKRLLRKK